MHQLLLSIFVLLFLNFSVVHANETFDVSSMSSSTHTPLSSYLSYYRSQEDIAIGDIPDDQWVKNNDSMLSFGYSEEWFYIRVLLSNGSSQPAERVVSIDFPLLDHVEFFKKEQSLAISGDMHSFSQRDLPSLFHGFKVSLEPHEQSYYYFKINTLGGVQLPINIYYYDTFFAYESYLYSFASFLLGVIFSVCILGVILGAFYKEKNFFTLVFFGVSAVFFGLSYYGILYRYVYPDSPVFQQASIILTVSLFILSSSFLIRNAVSQIGLSSSIIKPFITLHSLSALLVPAIYFIFSYQSAVVVAFSFTTILFVGCFAIFLRRNKEPFVWIYISSWGLCGFASILIALSELGILKGPYYFHSLTIAFVSTSTVFVALVIIALFNDQESELNKANIVADIKQQDLLMDKYSMLRQLIGGLNHEINTPINTITIAIESAVAQLQSSKVEDEDIFMVLNSASNATSRISSILDEMNALARNNDDSKILTISIHELLSKLPNTVRHLNSINYEFSQVSPEHSFLGSHALFNLLFINLANNSIYALHEKGHSDPRISISSEIRKDKLVISWFDNGTGMTDSQKKKIFDPFFTTKPVGEGTGLGMSNVMSIVRIHGGLVSVSSKKSVFTEFTIELPLAPVENRSRLA